MKLILKAGSTSQSVVVFVRDTTSTTGAGLAGVAFGSVGREYRRQTANAAPAVSALSTMTLGTWASDGWVSDGATGIYEYGIPDAALADTAGVGWVRISLTNITNGRVDPIEIMLVKYDPQDATRLGLVALPTGNPGNVGGLLLGDANGAGKIQTGTGTGQIDFTAGIPKANLTQILGTTLTETAGQIAGGFKKFFNIASPGSTMDLIAGVTTVTGVSGNVGGTVGSVVGNVNGNVTGSVGSVTGAVGSVTGNVGGNVTGSVGSVVGAVGSVTGNVGGNVVGSVASVSGNVGGNVTGSVASVVGAVGSVTGNVGGNVVGSVASVTGNVGGNVVGNVNGNVAGSVASVTGNVGGNVVGSVASVTGNIGGNLIGNVNGNVAGSVGSVVAGIAITSIGANAITAASIAPDAGVEIAQAVWDFLRSAAVVVGSFGKDLSTFLSQYVAPSGGGGGGGTNFLYDQMLQTFNNIGIAGIGDLTGLPPSATVGTLSLALHSGSPQGHTQDYLEASYSGYNRILVVRSATGWTVTSGVGEANVINAAIQTFGTVVSGSGTLTYLSVGSGASGATEILYVLPLDSAFTVAAGNRPSFAAGGISITIQ